VSSAWSQISCGRGGRPRTLVGVNLGGKARWLGLTDQSAAASAARAIAILFQFFCERRGVEIAPAKRTRRTPVDPDAAGRAFLASKMRRDTAAHAGLEAVHLICHLSAAVGTAFKFAVGAVPCLVPGVVDSVQRCPKVVGANRRFIQNGF
jgi:hypothetical protein